MATAIPTACLASSAIRCRDVETGPTRGVLAVFPSNGAPCRCPPSLHGVSWAQFPRFGGTLRHADSSPPVGLEFVIRPPLEAGPCPGSGRSNAHG